MPTMDALESPRVGLVLGGGGVAGMAFHAGVLWALQHDHGWGRTRRRGHRRYVGRQHRRRVAASGCVTGRPRSVGHRSDIDPARPQIPCFDAPRRRSGTRCTRAQPDTAGMALVAHLGSPVPGSGSVDQHASPRDGRSGATARDRRPSARSVADETVVDLRRSRWRWTPDVVRPDQSLRCRWRRLARHRCHA